MHKPLWVERTKPAIPSKLGVFLACKLRYVLETERPALKRIGEHPSALLGTAVHDAAEVLRRRLPAEALASVSVLEQCIGRLVAHDSPSRQLIAWVLGRYGKNALLPRAQFISQAGFAWALAQRLPQRRVKGAGSLRDTTRRIPVGWERRLASATLDLAGRADEIYLDENRHVRIVDFKSGSIRDNEGHPKRSYVLQLAAYGLAIRELDPNVDITLELLGKGDQWIGTLDPSTVQAVSHLLGDLRAALPRGKPMPATGLACIGEQCAQCAYRPSCPPYRTKLELEGIIDHGFYGFDVCGTCIGVAQENGVYAIRLALRQGFAARISCVPAILLPGEESIQGGEAAAFGIRSLEPARSGSLPQNFSIVDVQHPRNSAFQSCLDVE
jgi:PD-(D/E)XK nuclease superfamily